MPTDLLIHPTTRHILDATLANPPHAMVLVGPNGVGKRTLATRWALALTNTELVQVVEPDDRGTIGIVTIRELYRQTRAKRTQPQVIIIDHAEAMSLEAENALLKLLEEPRPGVTFVLCVPHLDALLPTVVSRAQPIGVQTITDDALQSALTGAYDAANIAQALFIARGRPGMFMRLTKDDRQFETERSYMKLAKGLLTATLYDRYLAVSKLAGDRTTAIAVADAMLYMVHVQLKGGLAQAQMQQWLALSQALDRALYQLQHNGNVKVQLLRLFTSY